MSRARMLAGDVVRILFDRAVDEAMGAGWLAGYTCVHRSRPLGPVPPEAFDVEGDDEDGETVVRRVTLDALRAEAERTDPLLDGGYEWLARTFNASPAAPVRS